VKYSLHSLLPNPASWHPHCDWPEGSWRLRCGTAWMLAWGPSALSAERRDHHFVLFSGHNSESYKLMLKYGTSSCKFASTLGSSMNSFTISVFPWWEAIIRALVPPYKWYRQSSVNKINGINKNCKVLSQITLPSTLGCSLELLKRSFTASTCPRLEAKKRAVAPF
jgi:hypothetical protein